MHVNFPYLVNPPKPSFFKGGSVAPPIQHKIRAKAPPLVKGDFMNLDQFKVEIGVK